MQISCEACLHYSKIRITKKTLIFLGLSEIMLNFATDRII